MRSQQRGFAMIAVMLLSAVAALVAANMLQLVNLDLVLTGNARRADEAREIAEGSVMELIEDIQTPDLLPLLDDSDLRATYNPSANSAFLSSTIRRATVDMRLVRVVPLAESSLAQTRAVVHEVTSASNVGSDEARAEIRTEIFRVVAFRPGLMMPRRHGR